MGDTKEAKPVSDGRKKASKPRVAAAAKPSGDERPKKRTKKEAENGAAAAAKQAAAPAASAVHTYTWVDKKTRFPDAYGVVAQASSVEEARRVIFETVSDRVDGIDSIVASEVSIMPAAPSARLLEMVYAP